MIPAHDLPYYSKFLLCAAYLASYNPARLDPTFFLKASDPKKRRRGGVRKQAGTRKVEPPASQAYELALTRYRSRED